MDREQPNAVYAPPAAFEPALPAPPVDLGKSTRAAGWMVLVQCAVFVGFYLVLLRGSPHVSGMIWLALQVATGVALLRVRHTLMRPLAVVLLVAPLTYQMASGADHPKHAAGIWVVKLLGLFILLAPQLLLLVGRPANARHKTGIVLFVMVQVLLVVSIAVTALSHGHFPQPSAPARSLNAGSGARP